MPALISCASVRCSRAAAASAFPSGRTRAGSSSRQLRLILVNKDEAVVQPGAIAKQSVAVQGLSALEALMTDKEFPLGPGEPPHYRCELAEAIAANVASVSDEIAAGWEKPGGWKDKMLHPGPENDTYKSPEESASELVKALLTGLSLTADLQLKPQVKPNLKLVPPFQKSGLQKAYYASSVESLRSLYDALELEDYLHFRQGLDQELGRGRMARDRIERWRRRAIARGAKERCAACFVRFSTK